jgi:hypothetical protein
VYGGRRAETTRQARRQHLAACLIVRSAGCRPTARLRVRAA